MTVHVRRATGDDADILATLLADYLGESYPDHPGSTPAQLRRDVLTEPLRGGAYDRATTRRFYARAGVILPSGETHLGGRALRHLAQWAGKPVREALRNLPPVAWNFEA
ncbi:MAG TPA: hypothetical protein VGR59_03440 [Gemmatimonadaceae bacterium]|nr:hypothetical protein [Gemmatimonadaceae bacterium]